LTDEIPVIVGIKIIGKINGRVRDLTDKKGRSRGKQQFLHSTTLTKGFWVPTGAIQRPLSKRDKSERLKVIHNRIFPDSDTFKSTLTSAKQ
jgi:hypothetical protein